MKRLVSRLLSQERALANAREASTKLSRERVQRAEVEIYLQERNGRRVTKTA
jgi:hypothetical protein